MSEWHWALVVIAAICVATWYIGRAIDRFGDNVRELGRLIDANSQEDD